MSDKDILLYRKILEVGQNRLLSVLNRKSYMTRLTPYFSNNYNFLYGMTGILYGLEQLEKNIPQYLIDSTLEQIEESENDVSISSVSKGKLGALITIYKFTLDKHLEYKIRNLLNYEFSKLTLSKEKNYSLANGLAGVGFLSLIMFKLTKNDYYLSITDIVAKIILQHKIVLTKFGLAYGNTGLALFLIKYYIYNKQAIFLKCAKKYLLIDIQEGQLKNNKNKLRGIIKSAEENIPYIYLPYGTSGIIKTIIVYLKQVEDYALKAELSFLVNSLKISSTLQSGYIFGTAGVISTLNDVLNFAENDPYCIKKYMKRLIESLLSTGYRIKDQIIFPGDQNFREFIDYGSGLTGILLTFKKLIDSKEFDPIFKD